VDLADRSASERFFVDPAKPAPVDVFQGIFRFYGNIGTVELGQLDACFFVQKINSQGVDCSENRGCTSTALNTRLDRQILAGSIPY
jgi:hypothetical protein